MRMTLPRLGLLVLFGGGSLLALPAAPASAEAAKLEARYVATLAGISVGRGAWVVEITDDMFSAAASGTTAGMMRVFSSGQGTSAARGSIVSGRFVPNAYASNVSADKRTDDVRMAMVSGIVRETAVKPPPFPDPDRVPLTDAHRRNVIDPMTASLVRAPGVGDPLGAESCARSVPIFDGRIRYDLRSAFKRMDKVKADTGYEGTALVCSIYFEPIAGHIPDRAAIKYLREQRDMEVWLAPIAGTRVLVPFRIDIPTPVGLGSLQAMEFVTSPLTAAAKSQ